jgi:Trypsin-like peptidase domain
MLRQESVPMRTRWRGGWDDVPVIDTGFRTNLLYAAKQVHTTWVDPGGRIHVSKGTGFVLAGAACPLLVTNRHVVDPGYRCEDRAEWRFQSVSTIGIRVTSGGDATSQLIVVSNPHPIWGRNGVDVAIVPLRGEVFGDMAEGTLLPIVDYFGIEALAEAEHFDGSDISTGDLVFVPGFPTLGGEQTQMPILASGFIASDPRTSFRLPGREIPESVLLVQSLSRSGLSGAPVYATQRGLTIGHGLSGPNPRPPRIVGINAGHISQDKDGPAMYTYCYKSTEILEAISRFD